MAVAVVRKTDGISSHKCCRALKANLSHEGNGQIESFACDMRRQKSKEPRFKIGYNFQLILKDLTFDADFKRGVTSV